MTITINFEHDSVWGYDESTWDGIDMQASEARLVELCEKEFTSAAIDAELTITTARSTVESDWDFENDERDALEIANRVWEQQEWYVNAA